MRQEYQHMVIHAGRLLAPLQGLLKYLPPPLHVDRLCEPPPLVVTEGTPTASECCLTKSSPPLPG